MRSPWYQPIVLETVKDSYDSYPASAGVYVVMSDRPISRIGGVDKKSVIYIGKAKDLRERWWLFLKHKHTASSFLHTHLTVCQTVLKKPILTVSDVEKYLGQLKVRYSTPIDEVDLVEAERALLFTYIQHFGEAPPLNMSIPQRWENFPSTQHRAWAEKGLFG